MPRLSRIVLKNVPHHITQRGNNQQDVFFVDDDRQVYLDRLKEQSQRFGMDVLAYCLMSNHIHIIAVPRNDTALAKAIGGTHYLYTQYVNRMHSRSGHLWQNRFFSCPMDNQHLWQAMQYIETNPIRSGTADKPWLYPYSSASAHTTNDDPTGVLDMNWWRSKSDQFNWQDILERRLKKEQVRNIRLATTSGRPLATDSYLSKLEKIAGRRLRPLPVGRPKKKISDNKQEENRQEMGLPITIK
ncbi:MAG TPA: transposase [Phycisphaerales bacterium]|nr:transposase [Phycisphaerales bacterium]